MEKHKRKEDWCCMCVYVCVALLPSWGEDRGMAHALACGIGGWWVRCV
jgi:hypothetical protein